MEKIIGFIGCGNMGQAMMGGIINSKIIAPKNIIMSDQSEKRLEAASEKYGINTTTDNIEAASKADILILSVKPNIYSIVIEEIKDCVKNDVVIVTIAAGQRIVDVEKMFGKEVKIIRTMPNTPALVGEGISALCSNKNASKEDLNEIRKIFESFGKTEILKESLIDAFIAVSGSSPAYVFIFIEAMADAAVLEGIPRDKAYKMAAQAVLGSAKMVLETGKHPGELKDMVCSPGGTTIEAVAELEERGFRSAVISAMRSCANKGKEMSNR